MRRIRKGFDPGTAELLEFATQCTAPRQHAFSERLKLIFVCFSCQQWERPTATRRATAAQRRAVPAMRQVPRSGKTAAAENCTLTAGQYCLYLPLSLSLVRLPRPFLLSLCRQLDHAEDYRRQGEATHSVQRLSQRLHHHPGQPADPAERGLLRIATQPECAQQVSERAGIRTGDHSDRCACTR